MSASNQSPGEHASAHQPTTGQQHINLGHSGPFGLESDQFSSRSPIYVPQTRPARSVEKPGQTNAKEASSNERRQRVVGDPSPLTRALQAAKKTADREHPEKIEDDYILRILAVLIKEHGAEEFTHWRRDRFGTFSAVGALTSNDDPESNTKARELAEQCLESDQVEFKIFSASERHFLVAAPVPCVPNYAISVQFPFNRVSDAIPKNGEVTASQYSAIQLRCRDVGMVAAHLGIVHLRKQLESNARNKGQSGPDTIASLATRLLKRIWKSFVAQNSRQWVFTFAILLAIGLIPVPHRVRCKVTCEPAVRRYVAAPFDGKLLETKVLPGDTVVKGQTLAVFDGSDLRSEIAGLRAALAQASQRRSAALSTGDASNSELERLETEKLRGEIRILEQRIENLEIRSPVSGVVVSGDLQRQQGAPLSVGDNLFEIAPLNQVVAEIAIPESDISYVAQGMTTRIALESQRGRSQTTKVTKIHPRNEMLDGQSVFVAEADMQNDAAEIRPGMTGTARVYAGLKPLGWVLLHRPYEVLRQWVGW